MPALIKIKTSELLQQVLDQINALELHFYKEDMNEVESILDFTSQPDERIKIIKEFLEPKRKELLYIDNWCRYKPKNISDSVFFDLKSDILIEEENFILNEDQLLNFTSSKGYCHDIASITVLFKILENLDKMLSIENSSVYHEPHNIAPVIEQQNHSTPFQWNKSDTDFLELCCSFFEEEVISVKDRVLTRKEMVQEMSKIFNLNIKDVESKLSRAKRRKKNEAPFLDSLRTAFVNACYRSTSRD